MSINQYRDSYSTSKYFQFLVVIRYLYFAYVFVSLIAGPLNIPFAKIGSLWVGAVAFLIFLRKPHSFNRISPMHIFPFLITVTTCGIMSIIHGLSWSDPIWNVVFRLMVVWILNSYIVSEIIITPKCYEIMVVVISITLVIGYFSSAAILGDYNRLSIMNGSSFGNSNDFAHWCSFCVLSFLFMSFRLRDVFQKSFFLIMAAVFLILALSTFSRATLLGLAASGIFYLFLLITKSDLKRKNFLANIVLIGLLFLVILQLNVFETISLGYSNRWEEETGRMELWPAAIEVIRKAPVWGWGNLYQEIYMPLKNSSTSTHNPFLRLATYAGVVPSIILLMYYTKGFVKSYIDYRTNSETIYVVVLLFFMFLAINTSNWEFVHLPMTIVFSLVFSLSYEAMELDGSKL